MPQDCETACKFSVTLGALLHQWVGGGIVWKRLQCCGGGVEGSGQGLDVCGALWGLCGRVLKSAAAMRQVG